MKKWVKIVVYLVLVIVLAVASTMGYFYYNYHGKYSIDNKKHPHIVGYLDPSNEDPITGFTRCSESDVLPIGYYQSAFKTAFNGGKRAFRTYILKNFDKKAYSDSGFLNLRFLINCRQEPKIDGFPYNKEKDEYSCPMDRPLPFKGFSTNRDGSVLKNYWAAPRECKACPMKSQCAPKTKSKKIARTVYDEQYLRAYARQHSERGKQMKKLRQSTVEPVFGSLTQFYGLRKIGVLGKAGAHKVMLMAAIAFNLKKYLKKGGRKPSLGIFKTIMDASQGCLTIFYWQIRQRPVLQKAP